MKDYSIWVYCASFFVGGLAFLLNYGPIYSLALLMFYEGVDGLGWKWILNWQNLIGSKDKPPKEAVLAYRFLQHGVMIPLLVFGYYFFGWQAPAAPLIMWIMFAADILYHPITKSPLPMEWDSNYFNYGFWSGPLGWFHLFAGIDKPMNPWLLYIQAVISFVLAVYIWV